MRSRCSSARSSSSEFSEVVSTKEISVVDLAANYGKLSEDVRGRCCCASTRSMGWTCRARHLGTSPFRSRSSGPGCAIEHGRARRSESLPAVPAWRGDPHGGPESCRGTGGRRHRARNGNGDRGRGCSHEITFAFGPAHARGDPALVARGVRGTHVRALHGGQLAQGVAAGEITSDSMVWTVGMVAWTPMGRVLAWRSCSLRLRRRRAGAPPQERAARSRWRKHRTS